MSGAFVSDGRTYSSFLRAASEDMDLDGGVLGRLEEAVAALVLPNGIGAQVVVARHGHLVLDRTFGTVVAAEKLRPASDDTVWLLYSNTKMLLACALWILADRGQLRFGDAVAEYLPWFAAGGKESVTVLHLLTHQAGMPSQDVPPAAWHDRTFLQHAVAEFRLEWEPGSRVHYHRRSAYWIAALVIESIAGVDYREFVRREVLVPLGLESEVFLGLPDRERERAADMYARGPENQLTRLTEENDAAFRGAGIPSSGAFGTARAMALFYQMMLGGGSLHGRRLLSSRMVDYITRDFTGDRIDGFLQRPMHYGLGPHLRATDPTVWGLGSLGSPRVFGHGGVGSSYCWADPDSGVSFAFVTNGRDTEGEYRRMETLSNLVHASIQDRQTITSSHESDESVDAAIASIDFLQSELAKPAWNSSPSDEIARVLTAATRLASKAFDREDEPEARVHAERLLHYIHVVSAFAPPVQGSVGAMWNVLARAKLRAALTPYDASKAITADEMERLLVTAVEEADARDHGFIDEIVAAPTLRGLVIYAKNWFGSTHGFTPQLIALAQRCTPQVQRGVLTNIADETQATEHEQLRARFLAAIGLRHDAKRAHEDPDQTWQSLSLLNYRTAITTVSNPAFALGSFYSIEAVFPPVCRRLLVGLRKRGFEEAAIETFRLHVETDEDHAAEWMDLLKSDALSAIDRSCVVAGALAQLQLRHELFDATRALFAAEPGA